MIDRNRLEVEGAGDVAIIVLSGGSLKQDTPVYLCLRGQLYVDRIGTLMREHGAKEVSVYLVRSSQRVNLTSEYLEALRFEHNEDCLSRQGDRCSCGAQSRILSREMARVKRSAADRVLDQLAAGKTPNQIREVLDLEEDERVWRERVMVHAAFCRCERPGCAQHVGSGDGCENHAHRPLDVGTGRAGKGESSK